MYADDIQRPSGNDRAKEFEKSKQGRPDTIADANVTNVLDISAFTVK